MIFCVKAYFASFNTEWDMETSLFLNANKGKCIFDRQFFLSERTLFEVLNCAVLNKIILNRVATVLYKDDR